MSIKIGDKVKDIVTGFEGVCTAIAKLIYNCDRIQITLMDNPEKIGECHWFDSVQVEVVGETYLVALEPVKHNFKFGDKVKDKFSEFNGVVMQIANFANGCVRLGVQSSVMKDGLPIDEMYLAVQQAVLIEPVIVKETPPVRTGGPCKLPKMMR